VTVTATPEVLGEVMKGTPRARARGYTREEVIWAVVLLAPTALATLVFVVFPVLFSLYMSFHKWIPGQPSSFVGLAQYRRLLTDQEFLNSLKNTVQFVIGYVPGTLVAALLVALLMNAKIRGRNIYRMLFFLPSITSIIVLAEIWLWIYEPRFGLINYYLGKIGLPNNLPWLSSPDTAMWSIVIMSIWAATGYFAVLFLAGLNGIDRTMYDAAKVDGAGEWGQFWYITLPLLAPTTFFILTMLVIGAFQVFGQIYVMTRGGPIQSTEVVVYTIYTNAFGRLNMGYASTEAYVVAVIMFILTVLQWRFFGRNAQGD
jgi:multiple sugar transport system permease protein